MQDIQTKVMKTLAKNMQFLSRYDGELFAKISVLQQAMEDGSYQSNYALEFVDGYFDVKNLRDGSWLYGMNSNEFGDKKYEEVDFNKASSSLSMMYRRGYSDAMVEDLEQFSAVNSSVVLIAPIEHILTKKNGRKPTMKQIYKFAFLGIGLGVHLQKIAQKINAYHYLLVEDNLELFYLSLFVCDYEDLSKKAKLYFCIMEDNDSFNRVFVRFNEGAWMRNDFLKFSLFSDDYASKIKQMQTLSVTKSSNAYPQNLLLRKNINISKALQGGYRFLNLNKIYTNSPLAQKKVLFLAAGPSLSKHIDWVKQHRDKFFIVSVFMIAKKLCDSGIKPDIFVHVDENEAPLLGVLRSFEEYSYFDNCMFLLSPSTPLHFFEKLIKKSSIYLCEDRTRYKAGFGNLEFYSVGEAGYSLCLYLGANELYLLGLDLALDQTTGQTHASGHASASDKKDLLKSDEVEQMGSIRDTVLKVKANRGGEVATTPLFEVSIRMLNELSKRLLIANQRVYNLGDGAYFDQIVPLNIEDVNLSDKDKDIDIKDFLDSISEKGLNEKDKNNIAQRKQDLKRRIRAIVKFAGSNPKNPKELHSAFVDLAEVMVNAPKNMLVENYEITGVFMENFAPFVAEYLNTKEALISYEDIKEVKETIARELKKLVSAFGYMEFDYLKAHKYFKPYEGLGELEDKYLDFSLKYQDQPQLKELVFEEHLKFDIDKKLLDKTKLLPLSKKKGFAILASNINIKDDRFLGFVKMFLDKVDGEDIFVFCFEKYQEIAIKDKLKQYQDRVHIKYTNSLEDIANSCRVFLSNNTNTKSTLDLLVAPYFFELYEVLSIGAWVDEDNKSLKDLQDTYSEWYDYIKKNIFGDSDSEYLFFHRFYTNVLKKFDLPGFKLEPSHTLQDMLLNVILPNAFKSEKFCNYITDFDCNRLKKEDKFL